MTSYESLYKPFFDKIEKDSGFFSYNNVNSESALILAKSRAKAYLKEAISVLELKCSLDIDIDMDDDLEIISVDFTNTEINLISSIMYEIYLSRDIAILKSMVNALTSADIKMLYAPANERKTFMEMYTYICNKNDELIDKYNSRDRLTGKLKTIDHSKYDM